jgi:diadenylate cyclase
MLEGFRHLFAARPWLQVLIDVLDIAIVAYLVYRALLVVRGTRAMQMATGLGVIFLVYVVSKWAGLVTLFNALSTLLSSIILISVVVFQNDIRRGLMRVGSRAVLGGMGPQQESRVIDEIVAAANELARHRMGALICFEQDANLDEFVAAQGTSIDASVQRDLLVSLFIPESVNKLHDGAVVIRSLRIARAGVFFPMPDTRILDKSLGSRHRAALGITEETDAVVVVVSEERGTISCCFNGNIVPNLDGPSLKQVLLGLFGRRGKAGKKLNKKLTTGSFRVTLPPGSVTASSGGTGSVKIHVAPIAADSESVPSLRVSDNPEDSHPLPPTSTPAIFEASRARAGSVPDADDSQPNRPSDPSVARPMTPSPDPSAPPPPVKTPTATPVPSAPSDGKD